MKTLYHGSYMEVSQPLAKAGRRNLDFGPGFYLTKIKDQAEKWAMVIASRKGRNVQPVIAQPRVANAQPATQIMIDTYMAALGFDKTATEGRFSNGTYEVWDLVPRNVLVDNEGDIFVVDAEIKQI